MCIGGRGSVFVSFFSFFSLVFSLEVGGEDVVSCGETEWERRRTYEAVDLVGDFEHGVVSSLAIFPGSEGLAVAHVKGSVDEREFIFGDSQSAIYPLLVLIFHDGGI